MAHDYAGGVPVGVVGDGGGDMTSLILVKFIDYDANYAYSPPEREGVINPAEIVSVVSIERGNTRRPFDDLVRICFRDGTWLDVIGKPSDFYERVRIDSEWKAGVAP